MGYLAPDDCPPPPAMNADLATLLVHEACETAGGLASLSTLLGVPAVSIQRWLDGEEPVPEHVYRACADIVLLHEGGAKPS